MQANLDQALVCVNNKSQYSHFLATGNKLPAYQQQLERSFIQLLSEVRVSVKDINVKVEKSKGIQQQLLSSWNCKLNWLKDECFGVGISGITLTSKW